MSTSASRNRVHCTHANEGDDMLVRGMRVPVAAEGREESAEAVPEQEVQVEVMEPRGWRVGSGLGVIPYRTASREELAKLYPQAASWPKFEPERAVAEDAGPIDQADGFAE